MKTYGPILLIMTIALGFAAWLINTPERELECKPKITLEQVLKP